MLLAANLTIVWFNMIQYTHWCSSVELLIYVWISCSCNMNSEDQCVVFFTKVLILFPSLLMRRSKFFGFQYLKVYLFDVRNFIFLLYRILMQFILLISLSPLGFRCTFIFCFARFIRLFHNLLWQKGAEWFGSTLSRTLSLLLPSWVYPYFSFMLAAPIIAYMSYTLDWLL